MWDLVPQPGIEPGPPALGVWSLTHWTTREVSWGPLLEMPREESGVGLPLHSPEWSVTHSLATADKNCLWDFPGGAVVKNLPANAGDMGSLPGPGRSHMQWSN